MKNFGVSFGWMIPSLLWINVLVWLAVVWWWWKRKNLGLGLIVVGGALNLWERLTRGYVNDYWQIGQTGIYNNVNDWLIFGGILVYLWSQWKKKSK